LDPVTVRGVKTYRIRRILGGGAANDNLCDFRHDWQELSFRLSCPNYAHESNR
jgi:hypothetical protein